MEELFGGEPIRRSPVALAVRVFTLVILVGGVYALMGMLAVVLPENFAQTYVVMLWLLYTLLNIVVSVFIVRAVMDWLSTTYIVSGNRLIEREGMYSISEKIADLHRLEAVDIHQSWLGHRLHYGTIILGMVGPGFGEKVELHDVADPEQYDRIWYREARAV